jgi:hypothetical protein
MEGLIMTMGTPIIAYHAKKDNTGWREVCQHPADWEGWHPFDKGMIKEMLEQGHSVVTIGWNMYQVVR